MFSEKCVRRFVSRGVYSAVLASTLNSDFPGHIGRRGSPIVWQRETIFLSPQIPPSSLSCLQACLPHGCSGYTKWQNNRWRAKQRTRISNDESPLRVSMLGAWNWGNSQMREEACFTFTTGCPWKKVPVCSQQARNHPRVSVKAYRREETLCSTSKTSCSYFHWFSPVKYL